MNTGNDSVRVGPRAGVPIGLSIAGFDPSSGAGVTADLKVFEAHGVYGMAAIAALTVQSTLGVRRGEPVSSGFLAETLQCLRDDVSFAGVKIGMLATEQNICAVASWLARSGVDGSAFEPGTVVLDPVVKSSSGAALADDAAVEALRIELLGRVGWITPNWMELAVLTSMEVNAHKDLPIAARRLQEMARSAGNRSLNVVATGGDQSGEGGCEDFLMTDGGEQFWLTGERVDTTSTHGTGCAFSTALLCELIAGKNAFTACSAAKAYVARALQAAFPVGRGRGPLNPFV